ncbi:alpha,alpha-trehalase [Teladorsagia circumcincta]|uniref:Trehalase n=1 Tax=Teladorsagia circumcincta TaxID=45464 RepID=A0A2G9V5M1_TELCI|nr:alpha,alpha-trehalase [Teladorsagia circumcincta]
MVYCSGKLLQAVMATKLYNDSKTFVDQPMKEGRTGSQIISDFERQFPQPVSQISREDVKRFVDENFDKEGQELQSCTLSDWTRYPAHFKVIKDNNLRLFALNLNAIWKELCREMKPAVKDSPERFSLLYVPHRFVVPGGRFREFYYWDAYWIVKGLLASGMTDTTKSMIQNFAYIVQQYGFIPNGGRVYYLRRSQPPLFIPMVYEYYLVTRDKDFLNEMLPIMEREIQFWQKNRTISLGVDGETITMYQYRTPSTVPRPESYREDDQAAANITDPNAKLQFFQDIASGAESGWDFSIRWFADKVSLTSIETTNVVPVDLNAFICYNLHILGALHGEVGNEHKSSAWTAQYVKFRNDFQKIFYVNEAKGWYDYNLRTKQHNTDFYASIAVPLFTQCYEPLSLSKSDDLYDKMEEMGVFNYVGGIPTSLQLQSKQQWDFPNGWSPLNHMIIEGLRKSDDPRMQQKSFLLAEKWILSNLHVFESDQVMWEKYDVVSASPRLGGGGEYLVQPGFGWTNGAVLDLLLSYGDRLEYRKFQGAPKETPMELKHGVNVFTTSTVIPILILYVYNLW